MYVQWINSDGCWFWICFKNILLLMGHSSENDGIEEKANFKAKYSKFPSVKRTFLHWWYLSHSEEKIENDIKTLKYKNTWKNVHIIVKNALNNISSWIGSREIKEGTLFGQIGNLSQIYLGQDSTLVLQRNYLASNLKVIKIERKWW